VIPQVQEPVQQDEHELAQKWCLWEKEGVSAKQDFFSGEQYLSKLTNVKTVTTIENFMEVFNGIPKPSTLMNTQDRFVRQNSDDGVECIDAYGFF